MKSFFLTIIILFANCAKSQPPDGDPNWKLTFTDDFNSYNSSFWKKINFSDEGSFVSEVVTLEANTNVSNGHLIFTTSAEYTTCPSYIQNNPSNNSSYPAAFWGCNQPYYNFTTGAVISVNSLFHYGYYEAKIKMDYAPGYWPSFWLIGYGGSSIYSEIDIFEMVGFIKGAIDFVDGHAIYSDFLMTFNHMTTNIHGFGFPDPKVVTGGIEQPALHPIADYRQWHTYGFEWWPNRMIWYVDGVMIRSIKTPHRFDPSIPMQVRLGPGLKKNPAQFNTSAYPAKMEVDYFKYYTLKADCSPAIDQDCYDFSTHTDAAKEHYSVGNTCHNTVPSNKNYFFKARDFVEIKETFEVPVGSTALFDAENYCAKVIIPTSKDCWTDFHVCNYDFSIYDNRIKNTIELGGNNCILPVNQTDNVKLYSKEYVKLSEGFSVPLNSELEVKILSCD